AGKHNIIRFNVVYDTHDNQAGDGNGIELDQWCDDNEVYFNLAFLNDGAGIVIFDGANNIVENNTIYGNARDPGRTHPYPADLLVVSDYTKHVDHAYGNILRNNLVNTVGKGRYAIYVDDFASRHMREISNNNLTSETPDSNLYFWHGISGRDIARWNALKPGRADSADPPGLIVPSAADQVGVGFRGFAPGKGSGLGERGIPPLVPTQVDLAGTRLSRHPIGAFGPAE
ncbi:MAG: right-handed parallel beta-helix repeat-containing protein, partial [Rhodospirillales bacterium]|nr:right-handed parallel beta-helix repeat-containing protein [Rhodospirillales bacterium]